MDRRDFLEVHRNLESSSNLLEIRDLKTYFYLDEGVVRAVDGVSFEIRRGAILGVVGESGCGKSVLARSIMRMIRPPGRTLEGEILYHRDSSGEDGNDSNGTVDLTRLAPNGPEIRKIRGNDITMIFQEPLVSFSPVHTVGSQMTEGIRYHRHVPKGEARDRAVRMLRRVGIPDAERRIDEHPFNFSGGMLQRAMIGMALSSEPRLLIADEPTTALDVTTQAQILELMKELQSEFGMAMVLISHNLGVVAQMAEEVIVMYLGKIVERRDVGGLFRDPKHPYTQDLLRSIPKLGRTRQIGRLAAISGSVPPPYVRPPGCPFHPRCPKFMPGKCDVIVPEPVDLGNGQSVSCLLYSESAETGDGGE